LHINAIALSLFAAADAPPEHFMGRGFKKAASLRLWTDKKRVYGPGAGHECIKQPKLHCLISDETAYKKVVKVFGYFNGG
jgi:hypothetical protein